MTQTTKDKIVLVLTDRSKRLQQEMKVLEPLVSHNEQIKDIYQMAHTYACKIAQLSDIVSGAPEMSQQLIDTVDDEINDADSVLETLSKVTNPATSA